MFFGCCLNTFLSLFVVGFLEIMEAEENIAIPAQDREMTDLKKLPWSVYCKFQKNEHNCGYLSNSRRYYYDVRTQSCLRFQYGSCNHTYNIFRSLATCRTRCQDEGLVAAFTNVTENVYCRFQPEFGDCDSYHPMWYFDVSEMRCRGFSFSGCGGNHNRFETVNDCLQACTSAVKQ